MIAKQQLCRRLTLGVTRMNKMDASDEVHELAYKKKQLLNALVRLWFPVLYYNIDFWDSLSIQ